MDDNIQKGIKKILDNQAEILLQLNKLSKKTIQFETKSAAVEHKVDRIWLLVKPAIDKLME